MMQPSRREMLRVGLGGLGAVSLAGSVPALASKFAFNGLAIAGSTVSNDNCLVIVQLSGGNDGLNTVIPVRDDAYRNTRPSIALIDRLHPIDGDFALNPGMAAFKALFDVGRLAIINGCGYPNPNRSHFKSLEVWHTAHATPCGASGWLGRYVEQSRGPGGGMRAVNIGAELPQALVADDEIVPSIQSMDELPAIDADAVRKVADRCTPDATYPGGLGDSLKLIAQLISANLGTKIFYCQLSGFDTHANQLGQHERLLRNMATSIAAFTKDMNAKGYGDKVAVMCFSEFGRRVAQNTSAGTDHGAAGPTFVIGGKVKGGIYGAYPSLTDLDDGDLKYTTDFRRVYATLLEKWLNANASAVLKNTFEPIAFL